VIVPSGGDKQMLLVRIGFAIAFGAFSVTLCQAAEVSLFDASGEAVAYIDTDNELTIYLWSGKPVAYLQDGSGSSIGVWGFNGKHLGWFERGAIWGDDGNATCATKEAMTSLPHLESLKSLKELKPLKSLKELSPLKPMLSGRFGRIPCAIYLELGFG
jgi:hypothetical protein